MSIRNDNFGELWSNFRRDVIAARTNGKRNISDTPAHSATNDEVLAEVSALLYDVYEAVQGSKTILDAMNKMIACDAGGRMGYWGDEGRIRSCLNLRPSPLSAVGFTEEEYLDGYIPTMPEDTTADVQNAREDEYLNNK